MMQSRWRLGWAALTLAWCGCASATLFPVGKVDVEQLKRDSARRAELIDKWSSHPAVVLEYEKVVEHDVEAGTGYWTVRTMTVSRYLVIDHKDKQVTTFDHTAGEESEITRAEMVVLTPGREPARYGKAQLVEEKKNRGRRGYKFAYPDIERGSIVEERVEFVCRDPREAGEFSANLPLRFTWPALRIAAAFAYPARWSVMIKRVRPGRALDARVYKKSGKKVIVATARDVPPQPDSIYSPYNDEDGNYLRVYIQGNITASMVNWSEKTWEERAEKYAKYVLDNDDVFSRKVSDLADELIDGIEG